MSNNDDNNSNKEWQRIMDNPDNVIMSEALISKVDPYDLGDIEPMAHVSADCEITFDDYSIVGTIVAFNNVKGEASYTAVIPSTEAFRLFNTSALSSIRIYSYDETLLNKDCSAGTTFDFEVEVQDGENSILTISFPHTA